MATDSSGPFVYQPRNGAHRGHQTVARIYGASVAAHCRCGAYWERTRAGEELGDGALNPERCGVPKFVMPEPETPGERRPARREWL